MTGPTVWIRARRDPMPFSTSVEACAQAHAPQEIKPQTHKAAHLKIRPLPLCISWSIEERDVCGSGGGSPSWCPSAGDICYPSVRAWLIEDTVSLPKKGVFVWSSRKSIEITEKSSDSFVLLLLNYGRRLMQFSGFWEPVELGRGFIVFCLSLHSLLRHWRESCECPPPPSTEGNGGEANHHLIMKFNKLDLKGILILLSFGHLSAWHK